MKWNIADVEIENQIALAPMSGECDSSFRLIAKKMGCGLVVSEMVSTNAIKYGSFKRTNEMLYVSDKERPIAIQLFGPDSDSFRIASEYVYDYVKPEIIDINMGCPVNKVAIKSKSGSALLKNPDLAHDIVETVTDTVDIPVTVKIRSGWDENNINAVNIAKTVEDAGASAITVHPRTKNQGYSGKADWSIIKDVKDELSIPVIGNGDIRSCYDAKEMIDETSCDAVMIGRGALGNPWLIRECVNYLDHGIEPEEISIEDKINLLKKHVELFLENNNEDLAIKRIRNPVSHYIKHFPNNRDTLMKLFKVNTKEDLFKLLDDYYNHYYLEK